MKKFVAAVLFLTYITPGCIYTISNETKQLAQDVHTYSGVQEKHIKDMLAGGEVTQNKATEIVENAEALTSASKSLSDLLGKPKKKPTQ
jgi:hypothetical protein